MSYQQLHRYLRTPPPITIDPLQRECNPPEDPDWPAPINEEEILELMRRLPHWAQVVCAVTAAEMVLWRWEDWVNITTLSQDQIEAPHQDQIPHQAIETTWQWLYGDATEDEVEAVARALWGVAMAEGAGGDAAARAAWAARAASKAAWSAGAPTRAAGAAAGAARDAARAVGLWGAGAAAGAARDAEFFREWWDLCRCRLAFILEARPLDK